MTPRNKNNNNFWQKIRFKYKLILLNENTLEDIFSLRISQLTAFIVSSLIAILFLFILIFLILGTPLRNYLPGYLNAELRTELVGTRMRLDSLTEQNIRRTIYLENIRGLLKGEIKHEAILPMDSMLVISTDSLPGKSAREQAFINRFAEEEKYNLTILTSNAPAEGMIFHPPVKGVISRQFDVSNGMFGIELLCARNAIVTAPLDGSVIFSSYTIQDGYVMQIQHDDGYISIFKNLHSVMREPNQRVEAGNIIGGLAREGEKEIQPRLHYELWHKGEPIDPQMYINF